MRSLGNLSYPKLVVLCFMCITEHFVPFSEQTNEYHLWMPGYMTLMIFSCFSFQIEIFTLQGLYSCIIFRLLFFFCLPASWEQSQFHFCREEKHKGVCWFSSLASASFCQEQEKAEICADLPVTQSPQGLRTCYIQCSVVGVHIHVCHSQCRHWLHTQDNFPCTSSCSVLVIFIYLFIFSSF